jgi:hypothetical protein
MSAPLGSYLGISRNASSISRRHLSLLKSSHKHPRECYMQHIMWKLQMLLSAKWNVLIVMLWTQGENISSSPSYPGKTAHLGHQPFIPFKNLIRHLFFHPPSPADPTPSSLVLSSTCSLAKTPDTCPDPNHQPCHNNDITTLDLDSDP